MNPESQLRLQRVRKSRNREGAKMRNQWRRGLARRSRNQKSRRDGLRAVSLRCSAKLRRPSGRLSAPE
jgi:hypothetical protein